MVHTSFERAPGRRRVVDERREEVEREDQRGAVVEAVDRGVVGRRKPDKQVLGLRRDEPGEQLLEAGGRVLGRAAARGDELGELHGHVANGMERAPICGENPSGVSP